jgi:hypothetical protein
MTILEFVADRMAQACILMEQYLQQRLEILTIAARRYYWLLDGAQQDLENYPNNSRFQTRKVVLENELDVTLNRIEALLYQLNVLRQVA